MTILIHSAEVRWFFRGELPQAFRLWFQAGKALVSQSRTDAYLRLPGCESVGVKQREGRFEIKARRGGMETVQYGFGVSGRMDAWVKWSYQGAGTEALITGLRQEPTGWIQVDKERWLRQYALDAERPTEVDPSRYLEEGCNLEMTRVQVQGTAWWTFGLESFGTPGSVRNNLRLAAHAFFSENRPPYHLHTAGSCSYPVWLNGAA